ncbi:alpha/beta hydrolase [Gordonia sp. X0973]|uniref:alpha/beta fold hydrolase n=1 Tax=Gordonia sp. X0973 TaxID=2742602 RepID=UPI000F539D7A|nr:alpha/beta hydrolase [Gordonia sp. X0973]QKT08452.1 alpha/beta hydrolase [Gordonia sp. X0973]
MTAETGAVGADALTDHGGHGPPILLLHGLMGRGRTWQRQVGWLRRYGRVFTVDAAWHTGPIDDPNSVDPAALGTERFVADIVDVLGRVGARMGSDDPAVLIGHSMGGLHAWCTAAAHPELVRALVVEDMAPDFKGQTTRNWTPWFETWPERFASVGQAQEMFGEVAGRYFYEAFDDGRLHGDLGVFTAIADQWGLRDYWDAWGAVHVPTLLVEAGFTVTPPGQMAQMAQRNPSAQHIVAPDAGHLVHDDAPEFFRGAVEAFLAALPPA